MLKTMAQQQREFMLADIQALKNKVYALNADFIADYVQGIEKILEHYEAYFSLHDVEMTWQHLVTQTPELAIGLLGSILIENKVSLYQKDYDFIQQLRKEGEDEHLWYPFFCFYMHQFIVGDELFMQSTQQYQQRLALRQAALNQQLLEHHFDADGRHFVDGVCALLTSYSTYFSYFDEKSILLFLLDQEWSDALDRLGRILLRSQVALYHQDFDFINQATSLANNASTWYDLFVLLSRVHHLV